MNLSNSHVTYVQHMGTDNTVADAARVSFDKLSEHYTPEQNHRLINYLARHSHWTPFSHCTVSLRVKAPIFVARQLFKHQVGGTINEVSRRYVDFEPEFHNVTSLRGRPVNAKQGSSDEEKDPSLINMINASFERSLDLYNELLEAGVCPEQARMVLPLGSMTDWYWTGSLVFWARVCNLRLDSHSQVETRDVAIQIDKILRDLYPVSWESLTVGKN